MRMSFATSAAPNPTISAAPPSNPYESDKLLNEYLLFHYGTAEEVAPHAGAPLDALNYPVRCVSECVSPVGLPLRARALDLGCAVGRSSFELARHCEEVVGVDYSHRFVAAAEEIRTRGGMDYLRLDEGECSTRLRAALPEGVDPARVRFEQGDAHATREGLGSFDVVLMANLIDRLRKPALCLQRLPGLVHAGGLLVVTSPYTWLEEYTAREDWLGGLAGEAGTRGTLEGLRLHLEPAFRLESIRDLPFLIREHARKYQWSVAQASVWRRAT
jgi:putative 4-mercaptohistidine N1-methyltranferase